MSGKEPKIKEKKDRLIAGYVTTDKCLSKCFTDAGKKCSRSLETEENADFFHVKCLF